MQQLGSAGEIAFFGHRPEVMQMVIVDPAGLQ
jgi:hypothetical protein